jgi:hypothetical protein
MTKITVGIPAFRTRFLVEAISSVLTQTFGDFELLVSDDSPDGSVSEIVRRIRDPRLRLIEGPRRGLVANSAHVWENASSPFLKFVYDDDKLYPTALAELLGLIERDERFVFAFSHRDVIDEHGRIVRRPQVYRGDGWQWFESPALAGYAVSNIVNPVGEPTALLIRRSAFPDSSCLRSFAGQPIRHLVDVGFMLNAASRGRAVASPERLCAFRQHSGQVSSDRASPSYSVGLFEWETFLRGAVQTGLVPPKAALAGLPKLDALYKRLGWGFDEIARFQAGLPALGDRLARGETDVLDSAFQSTLVHAESLIQARAAGPARAPRPYSAAGESRTKLTVESMTRRRAVGWAWLPDDPEKHLQVQAVLGDEVIGQARCDIERPKLQGIGTGRYGFDMTFREVVLGDDLPSFRVIIEDEEFPPGDHRFPPLAGEAPAVSPGGAAVLREHERFTNAGPEFEEFQPGILADRPRLVRGEDPLVAAFYLSQFHPIPENDAHWGPGFTEWRQLARAAPRFPGHYQPRIPRDLGFYNLLELEVIRRQATLAKAAGVGAFAFYYYSFDRKRVLEQPIEQFLRSDVDMPFFLIWANESWTRAWDGGERDILLEQRYRPEDEDALLADLARHMADPRYVRLQGRPLFVVYNAGAIPDPEATIQRWRRKWADDFQLEPLILLAQTFHQNDPRPLQLDGALEFPPHKLSAHVRPMEVLDAFSADFKSQVLPYDQFVRASLSEPVRDFPQIKTAIPSWDNDARRPNRGIAVSGSTPAKYQLWLQRLIERAIDQPVFGRPLVAINAWNEWAEGAYLEPDVHYGAAYLNATARALKAAIELKNAEQQTAGAT